MFPQKNNLAMRKKAMDSMVKEGPALQFKKKPSAMGHEEMMMGDDAAEEANEEKGMVSMMVSPDEKAMILQHRSGKKKGSGFGGKMDQAEEMAEGEY